MTTERRSARKYPIGVELLRRSGSSTRAHARLWAPRCRSVELVIEDDPSGGSDSALDPEGNGYFSGDVANVDAGTRYRFRLDGKAAFPDPASRFQPEGPHGPSMLVDPARYDWGDAAWRGLSVEGQVIYEMHVGTFTAEGTFRAAIERLPDIVDLGATVLEIMPVADFPGQFGWGYDGVNFFAPSRLYGTPDELRGLVDAAHRLELGVLLDVVYNHFGPDGNYFTQFGPYTRPDPGEWGDAPNYDGPDSGPVREYFLTNARYWTEEFHFDGLRLDATQAIDDRSSPHMIAEVAAAARAGAGGRATIIIGENEPQQARLARARASGGYGLDALWNDDFHHSARVAATGRNEAYFDGYRGTAQELVSAVKHGFLYQGEWYRWQHQCRGTPAFDLPPSSFVAFIANHDQLANSAAGRRLHGETSPGKLRALTALLLLAPQTPLLFQGQEFESSSPFLYFADHAGSLATAVRDGRRRFLSQFASIASNVDGPTLDDPADSWTFVRCKLDWSERARNQRALDLHRDLLRLRREDPVLRTPRPRRIDGAVLSEQAFVLRWFGGEGGDRLLVVNLGARLHAEPIAEPLVGTDRGQCWTTVLSTESPRYGGWGMPPLFTAADGWRIPAECAVFLTLESSLTDHETDAAPTTR
ncbi:MAG: malto-oligosyltrehalose trehalohydrolase [Gemmatimonadales bacterium]